MALNPRPIDNSPPGLGYSAFLTKDPEVYEVDQPFKNGKDIALYTHPNTGQTYAYITADAEGWYVVNVTDPTNPLVTHKENWNTGGGLLFKYRGVAVDQEKGILGITEWIQGSSELGIQFGYVRFYSLLENPQKPVPIIGQERIAEAYSGVPDRVVISGNHAYVNTLMVGLQVIDIDIATAPHKTGESLVGLLPTVDLEQCPQPNGGSKCGNPSDLALYKGNRLLIPTFTGYLLTVDVNEPTMPAVMSAFKPDNFGAWRVAVAEAYPYVLAGETKVMDLAVVSSGLAQSRIYTVDVTDPSSPERIGTLKDRNGAEVQIVATELTVSKGAGLAYATAGDSIYVIDIKDPHNPLLLNKITNAPDGDSGTTVPLEYSSGLVEKDGWVYLANSSKGMRVLDLDPKELGIQPDEEYSEVRIPETDYYPALETKKVTIYGIISGMPLNNEWGLYLAEPVNDVNLHVGGAVYQGMPASVTNDANFINSFTRNDLYRKGFAKLFIRWNGPVNATSEYLTIKLQGRKIGATTLNDATSTKIYSFTFRIRHNDNVVLQDVLDGHAVYVADSRESKSTGNTPDKQKFDFVQELINQVLTRMRKTYNGNSWVTNNYEQLINERGVFDNATANALRLFRQSFEMDKVSSWRIGNTEANFTGQVDNVQYVGNDPIDANNDNTTDSFRKFLVTIQQNS